MVGPLHGALSRRGALLQAEGRHLIGSKRHCGYVPPHPALPGLQTAGSAPFVSAPLRIRVGAGSAPARIRRGGPREGDGGAEQRRLQHLEAGSH